MTARRLTAAALTDAAGFVTTRGSIVTSGKAPATENATEVARLRAAGCVVLGKNCN